MTSVEKKKIISTARKNLEKFNSVSPTQIRKYLEVLKDPDLEIYEEYEIYIKYQLIRAVGKENMESIVNVIKEIKDLNKGNWRENLAYFFGILWRLKKIDSNKSSGGGKK